MSGRSKRPVVAKCRSPLHYRSDLAPVALEFLNSSSHLKAFSVFRRNIVNCGTP
jgi:hypothetical protein